MNSGNVNNAVIKILEYFLLVKKATNSTERQILSIAIRRDKAAVNDQNECWVFHCHGVGLNISLDQLFQETNIAIIKVLEEYENINSNICLHYDIKHDNSPYASRTIVTFDQQNQNVKTSTHWMDKSDLQGFDIQMKVALNKSAILDMVEMIKKFIYQAFLLNTQIKFEIHVDTRDSEEYIIHESNNSGVRIGQMNVANDTAIYTRMAPGVMTSIDKLSIKAGKVCILPEVTLTSGVKLKLKVMAAAAVQKTAKAITQQPATIKIFIFGPGNVPLISPGADDTSVVPQLLVNWSNYSINIITAASGYDLCFKAHSEQLNNNILLFYLFIQTTSENELNHTLEMLSYVRSNLCFILKSNQQRIFRASHSAIDKILHNYDQANKRQEIMKRAIPQIAESVCSIVNLSKNSHFKDNCCALMQAPAEEMDDLLQTKLWKIAQAKMPGLVQPSDDQETLPIDDSDNSEEMKYEDDFITNDDIMKEFTAEVPQTIEPSDDVLHNTVFVGPGFSSAVHDNLNIITTSLEVNQLHAEQQQRCKVNTSDCLQKMEIPQGYAAGRLTDISETQTEHSDAQPEISFSNKQIFDSTRMPFSSIIESYPTTIPMNHKVHISDDDPGRPSTVDHAINVCMSNKHINNSTSMSSLQNYQLCPTTIPMNYHELCADDEVAGNNWEKLRFVYDANTCPERYQDYQQLTLHKNNSQKHDYDAIQDGYNSEEHGQWNDELLILHDLHDDLF